MDSKIRDHLEIVVSCISTILSVCALIVCAVHHSACRQNLFGTLSLYIVSCILFGAIYTFHYCANFLFAYFDVDALLLHRWSWQIIYMVCPRFYAFLCGAVLALDRLLAMWIPVKHSLWNISKKMSISTVVVCIANSVLLVVSNCFFSYEMVDGFGADTDSFTYKYVAVVFTIHDGVFVTEVLLHILFCTQFSIYLKRKRALVRDRRLAKTNQIILFQALSQAILCLIPKLLTYCNKLFFRGQLLWVKQLENDYFLLLYSLNISIVSVFIVHRLRPKSLANVSVPSLSNGSRVTASRTA
ncbi:hypothetical protein QR680_008883 [Steinernema hermaphroditum]|uniref:Uncharacterized protein n=1 Tax=Steinernema hermaphroditum TaxID=289476 RepID=A0AA39IKF6_9BILA|nr:hypothetical protein QR680_008883 [Steinernema hermaphroditum]